MSTSVAYLRKRLADVGRHDLLRAADAGLVSIFACAEEAGLVRRREVLGNGSQNQAKKRAWTSAGHATWTDEEIEQYRARHPLGTMGRLALELMLNLASRRGDAIVLGRQHLKDGWLVYTQEKNRKRKPVKVEVPVAAPLAAALAACSNSPEALTFLTNEWGRPFAKQSFGRWFRQCCDEAGLPKTCVRTGCGRPDVGSWPRATAPRTRLQRSAAIERSRKSRGTPPPLTGSGWPNARRPRSPTPATSCR